MSNLKLPRMNKVSDQFHRTLMQISIRFGVDPGDILGNTRQQPVVLARQLFQFLLVRHHKCAPVEVATRFCTGRTGVLHNVKQIEHLIEVQDPVVTNHLAALRAS